MDRSVRSTEVSVAAVEGMESGRLVPPCNQLRRWIAEEAAYVRCARVRENSRKNFDFLAPPAKWMPARPRERIIGCAARRCDQSARLSPVHIAPYLRLRERDLLTTQRQIQTQIHSQTQIQTHIQ